MLDEIKSHTEDLLPDEPSLYSAETYTTVPPPTHLSVVTEADSLDNTAKQGENQKCKEVDKIYFLKTSKTGSTSVANLLMRFGLRRPGTTFLLGQTGNGGLYFENQYMPFNAESCYLGQELVVSLNSVYFIRVWNIPNNQI